MEVDRLDYSSLVYHTGFCRMGQYLWPQCYDFDNASIFDFNERSGKQLLWIGLSFGIGFILLMLEARMYEALAYFIYIVLMLLLVATIFLAPDIKGSRSWLVLGPVNLQPAEFAKFATALALARTDKFL